jgi:hypothetical protein
LDEAKIERPELRAGAVNHGESDALKSRVKREDLHGRTDILTG